MANHLKIKYNLDNVSFILFQKASDKQMVYQFYKRRNHVDNRH